MFGNRKLPRPDLEQIIRDQARELEETRRALGMARASMAQAWAVVETLGANLPQTVARAVVQTIMGRI